MEFGRWVILLQGLSQNNDDGGNAFLFKAPPQTCVQDFSFKPFKSHRITLGLFLASWGGQMDHLTASQTEQSIGGCHCPLSHLS